ncbi:Putative transposase DNA-binding domain-containing protein [Ferrithrix thermotolerans DSM 19514]|uniref:Putative transposase DNA-binding domain-containing protein n=1 Tax=Ferrithrix thermotolerans DSM 19514 TaxID=1121881 RepID=A0A1M4XEU9_9ACTN|nr:Putative transposase DNA-binding domain-containing protein [Ferrithrix thermotolerans DSM 19514]
MNVHLVDQAAFDAVDTCVRHLASIVATSSLKAKIWRRYPNGAERHYAYACLERSSALGIIMRGGTPDITMRQHSLTKKERKAIASYLHRALRKALAHTWPTVRLVRSMALDETLYSSFVIERPGKEHPGKTPKRRQYVQVIGPRPRERITIPLSGVSRVSGNIRVVLDEGSTRAFIHVAYEIQPLPGPATGPDVAIDWGITEVCTDDSGIKHGASYGAILKRATEQRKRTGQVRNKLWAITKKDAGSKRAKRIAKYNLGTKKQARRRARTQAALQTVAGAAIKEVIYGEGNRTRARGKVPQLPAHRPRRVIVEDLAQLRGKAKSKKISRLCSSWARSENEERMAVHAYIGRSDVRVVSAAYTSQTCPDPHYGYVSQDNRSGDWFHCRNPYWECNRQGDADHVAAVNLKTRINDPEIHRFTPHIEVKKILDARFVCRRESRTKGGDASPASRGQRDATSTSGAQGASVDGAATAHGRTSIPRRSDPDVGGGTTTDLHRVRSIWRGPGRLSSARAKTKGVPSVPLQKFTEKQ